MSNQEKFFGLAYKVLLVISILYCINMYFTIRVANITLNEMKRQLSEQKQIESLMNMHQMRYEDYQE